MVVDFVGVIIVIGTLVLGILLLRLLGAWVLRINDIIKIQKETLNQIKSLVNNQEEILNEIKSQTKSPK